MLGFDPLGTTPLGTVGEVRISQMVVEVLVKNEKSPIIETLSQFHL